MKISQMITRLEKLKAKHGNIELAVYDSEELVEGWLTPTAAFITLVEDDNGHVTHVALADKETAYALG